MAVKIPLTRGYFTLIDAEDYEEFSKHKWHAHISDGKVYAMRTKLPRTAIYLHRELMGSPKGLEIDHVDGNSLNNTKSNLRAATRLQNARSQRPIRGGSSKYKGVYKHKYYANKWAANITISGKCTYLGLFSTEVEAAKAYDQKAMEVFGEFAYLNLKGIL